MYIIYVRLQIALLNVVCAIRNVAFGNRTSPRKPDAKSILVKIEIVSQFDNPCKNLFKR